MMRLVAVVFAVAVMGPSLLPAVDKDQSMLFELRTYTSEPGKLADLEKRFRDHTVKLFARHGMVNYGYWKPETPDTLIYLLAHKDRAAADKSWANFRNDPEWQAAYKKSHENGPLVKKAEVQFLSPTEYSPVKSAAERKPEEGAAHVYELRIYTTLDGKLPNLNARFRDHTMKLFEKHGMTNLVYGVPTDEKLKDTTLIYLLSHKSREAADKSWSDFQADPEWKAARDASEKDGKILAPNGVKRIYLTATDYSPLK